jgi:hypothetical protein
MKTAITFFVTFLLCLPCAWGKKTGTVLKDTVYQDALYNFQINALKNWKISVEKEKEGSPSLVRLSMTKSNYQISRQDPSNETNPIIPTILICAQKSTLEPQDYIAAFFKNGKKLENQDKYIMKCDLLQNAEVFAERKYDVDKTTAEMVTLRRKFLQTVEDPRKRNDPLSTMSIVETWVTGYILVFKKNDVIYLVQFSADREFFTNDSKEFEAILSTWKFLPEKK